MSTAKKFILGAIGVAIAVLFGLWMLSVTNKGTSSMTTSMGQYDDIISNFSNTRLTMYDNGGAQGSEILDLIKFLDASCGYSIIVKNGANQASGATKNSVEYDYSDTNFEDNLKKAMDKSETLHYINPTASFKSTIQEDENGMIISITFVQEK